MALAGGIGAQLYPYEGRLPAHAAWFGEDQGRYVVAVTPALAEEVAERAKLLGLPSRIVARAGGDALTLKGETALKLDDLRATHEAWLPALMAGK
jgi:phosphoribosylformylglycinamidine synthase subunit PurL